MPGLEGGVPNFGRWKTRVRGAPEVLGHVPGVVPGRGDRDARATARSARCSPWPATRCCRRPAATASTRRSTGLDCMISVDNWLNETTRHADVILPGLSPLEQPHHDDLIWNFAVGSAANYSPAIFPPDGRPARGVGDPDPARRRLPRARTRPRSTSPRSTTGSSTCSPTPSGFDGPTIRAHYDHGGPMRMLDLTLRTGPFGDRYGENPDGLNLEKLKAEPHGIYFGPMEPCLAEVLATESGKVRLAPSYITDDLPRLAARLDRPRRRAGAREPAPPPVEQLLDAQRQRAGEGEGPLHAARAPERRSRARDRRRRARASDVRGRIRRRRRPRSPRTSAGRGLAPARLGPQPAGHAPRRSPTTTPASTPTCSRRGRSST